MNTTNGKIAEQSKDRLVKALLIVMEKYSFKEITITQLTQEAELSRKTFYRLFSDKEEVLLRFFEQLFAECLEQIKLQQLEHYWEVAQLYFDFWESRKEVLTLLKKNELLPIFFDFAYQHSLEVFTFVRSKEVVDAFAVPLPYLLAYAVGGMHSMLLKWVENDMNIPSEILIKSLKEGFQSQDI